MPAGSWVRGESAPLADVKPAAPTVVHARPPPQAFKRKPVYSTAGSWTKQENSKPHVHQGAHSTRIAPHVLSAKAKPFKKRKEDPEKVRLKQEVERKQRELEEIQRKKRLVEAQKGLQAAVALQKEQEEQRKTREEVASIAHAMEASERLKHRKEVFEVENKEELRIKKQEREARTRQIETLQEQREVVAHVLKQHKSHYDVLMIPESASSVEINKAWRRLSKMVHPDRCKLPSAESAFIKIKASVDALQGKSA